MTLGSPAPAKEQVELNITISGEFEDRQLEHEYRAHVRRGGRVMAQLLLLIGTCAFGWFLAWTRFLPLLAGAIPSAAALLLSLNPRTSAFFVRFLDHFAAGAWFLMAVALLIYTAMADSLLGDEDDGCELCCARAELFRVFALSFAMTVGVGLMPTVSFRVAILLTAPLLPFAIIVSPVPAEDKSVQIVYIFMYIGLTYVMRNAHVQARRSWFAVRRLRADNVFVRLNRQTVLSVFSGKTARSKVAQEPPQPWVIDPATLVRGGADASSEDGAFGKVFQAQWRGTTVAVKELRGGGSADPHVQQEFQDEIALLFSLRHPNVVLFMGVAVDQDRLLLVTEYVSGGSMSRILDDKRLPIPSKIKTSWSIETARGMQYLHGNEPPILHRDLKPENLLVDGAHVKIADFGLSGREQGGPARGTPLYMSPEALTGKDVGQSSDVYSFGIVVNQIWSRTTPYAGEYLQTILFGVVINRQRPALSTDLAPALRDLVQRCWAHEARMRPSFREIAKVLEGQVEAPSEDMRDLLCLDRPHGTVAHVAVDLVLMLDLWQRNPADAVHMCDAFGDAVSKAMVATEGFPARSEGGAHLVLFRDPPKAAVFVDRLRGEVAADTRLELVQQELRAGVHLGEALMDGETYFGPTVQRTVELCELCDGLEVRVSDDYFDEYGWSAPTVPDSDDGECRSADLVGRPRAEKVQRRTSHLSSLGRKAFPWMLQLEEIGNLCSLGTGPMAEVFSGQLPDGTAVAVKQLFVRRMSERARLGFLGQVGTLVALRHPNIAAVVGAVIPPPQRFCIVSQLLGPSLREALDTGSVPVRASRVRRDVGRGLAFLHRHGVAHGHLTSNNVVVSKEDGRVAVCDFGFQETRVETATMTKAIRFWWTAPEVLLGRAESTMAAAAAADVYSLGIVVWEAGTGRRPFDHVDEAKIGAIGAMAQIGEGERPEVLEEDLLDGELEFVRAAWSSDVGERPKLEEE